MKMLIHPLGHHRDPTPIGDHLPYFNWIQMLR